MKYTLRSLFVYEGLTGRPYEGKLLQDAYVLCYATLLACNPDRFSLTFDEFIIECDENPDIFSNFLQMLEERKRIEGQEQVVESKKKVTESR